MGKLIDTNALKNNNDYINNNINARLIDNAPKNLLNIINTNKTGNGITFTVNDDNSVTIAGTATAITYFNLDFINNLDSAVSICPTGNLTATFGNSVFGVAMGLSFFKTDGKMIEILRFAETTTFSYPTEAYKMRTFISIEQGATVNATIYPMIYRTGITDLTFEPYYRTQKQLDTDLSTIETDLNGWIDELPIGEKSVDFIDIISVDNAINVNAKSVKVKLEPTQDLHGYDKPWAGGQGKNLLPYLINECGWDANNDGSTVTLNSNEIIVHCLSTLRNGVYSRFPQSGGKLMPIITDNKPCYVSFDVVADISAVVSLGWEAPAEQQFAIGPTKQRISILYNNSNNNTFVCYNYSGEPVNITLSNLMVSKTEETEYEPYANICDISGYNSVDITQKDTETNPTVTNTYIVNLNNTYYGGELDVTNGILTFNRGYKLLTNTSQVDVTDVRPNIAGILAVSFDYAMKPYPNYVNPNDITPKALISNILPTFSGNFAWSNNITSIATNNTGDIVIQVKDITTESEMNTFLAENPIQICYELPTPQTIQLTPTQIEMLLNNNVLYCENGDISLIYYINDVIGECQKEIENLEEKTQSISIDNNKRTVIDNSAGVIIQSGNDELQLISNGQISLTSNSTNPDDRIELSCKDCNINIGEAENINMRSGDEFTIYSGSLLDLYAGTNYDLTLGVSGTGNINIYAGNNNSVQLTNNDGIEITAESGEISISSDWGVNIYAPTNTASMGGTDVTLAADANISLNAVGDIFLNADGGSDSNIYVTIGSGSQMTLEDYIKSIVNNNN